MPDEQSLEERVHAELLALRKSRDGVTVETLAGAETIRLLLGNGDPYVAYTRLSHEILDSEFELSIQAAAASLGLLAEGDTVLARLDAFGDEVFLDQRQVRRYSDRGLRMLSRLIATNWPTETVPQLSVEVISDGEGWKLRLQTTRLLIIEMREPVVTVLVGGSQDLPPLTWERHESDNAEHLLLREPVRAPRTGTKTSVVIVWRGELWPKFNVSWRATTGNVASETLGNKLLLRLARDG